MINFAEYLLNTLIMESKGDGTLPVFFSNGFKNILEDIQSSTDNEIATRLLWDEGQVKSKRVYIDIDPETNSKVSFIMSNKAIDILDRESGLNTFKPGEKKKIYESPLRTTMNLNKFVNTLYNNEYATVKIPDEVKKSNKEKGIITPSQHLENFVNTYKAIRTGGKFELVSGEDIMYWYHEDNYENDNGTLGGSCMKDDNCNPYMQFYADNPGAVSMLIMKSRTQDDKIIGRALVWDLTKPSGRIFMDRIYTNNDFDVNTFKKYASDKGWLYKDRQDMNADTEIYDPLTDSKKEMTLLVDDVVHLNDTYPYLDTLKIYNIDSEQLCNSISYVKRNGERLIRLEDTDGRPVKFSENTLEELKDRYADDIDNDIEYYAVDLFPNKFWDAIDNDRYMSDHKASEIEYYKSDFVHVISTDSVIEYLDSEVDEDDLPEDYEDLSISELKELLENDLNIFDEFIEYYYEDRYDGYDAEQVSDEINGETLTRDIYKWMNDYFDESKFRDMLVNDASEYDLRERYENEEL